MKLIANSTIKSGGKRYAEGEHLVVDDAKEAQALLDAGAARKEGDPAPEAESEDDDGIDPKDPRALDARQAKAFAAEEAAGAKGLAAKPEVVAAAKAAAAKASAPKK